MGQPKKLIEVALPIKEISAESVRDKSIRHGHISTLHLWWARRPLPVCRAVVFASLVPDPLDENCPQAFKEAVEILLGKANNTGDPYKPYEDIPYTAAVDKMEDNLRNRLLMFIGKYSNEFSANEKIGKTTASNKHLNDASLIKWDNKNNEQIIGKARRLIWVSHNSATGKTADSLIADYDIAYQAIKDAEYDFYNIVDRQILTDYVKEKRSALEYSLESFLAKMPKVFDPFAGGGAIPLEAARLGCRSYGNDINPVAHIIQKGSLEFPQKFGKPICYSKEEFIKIYGFETFKSIPNEDRVFANADVIAVNITNRLSFDVEFYSKRLISETEKEVGYLYPGDEKGNKPIAYYWARVGTCSNPTCKADVPLLRQFYLCKTEKKQVFLKPLITNNQIDFSIQSGNSNDDNWVLKGNLKCPCCGSLTDARSLRRAVENGDRRTRLLAVIEEGKGGKAYRLPRKDELEVEIPDVDIPIEQLPPALTGGSIMSWGYRTWGEIFSPRQLCAVQTLVRKLNELKIELKPSESEYGRAVITYLAILIDRVAVNLTTFGLWKPSGEFLSSLFGRQAISMVFDFPESNPFCDSTGSLFNQLDWIIRFIESESDYPFSTILQNASSGEKEQFAEKFISVVVTDPPYYDAIAYADLSDFFYVWLKRSLSDIYPLNFATPQTPKSEECTALKHHHNNDKEKAKKHFEKKLTQIFDGIAHQTSDLASIMFAHQSTEAWTTLCNSILDAGMNITGSWPMDSEREARALALDSAALESSVTVSCRPSQRKGYVDYKEVKKAIEKTVAKEVDELYKLGFRGADLLTACFGQAVSEFGKYEIVEKADGSEVTVAELLEMARESAFNALLKGFDGDDFTKFYIGWLQLYGFTQSDFDDAAKFSRVGLSINVHELFNEHILIGNGNKQTLGGYEDRLKLNKNLGDKHNSFLIDKVHRAMALYNATNRELLLKYIEKVDAQPESNFWRVITSLCEVLPPGSDDQKQALGLLTNKDSLIRESKTMVKDRSDQTALEL